MGCSGGAIAPPPFGCWEDADEEADLFVLSQSLTRWVLSLVSLSALGRWWIAALGG